MFLTRESAAGALGSCKNLAQLRIGGAAFGHGQELPILEPAQSGRGSIQEDLLHPVACSALGELHLHSRREVASPWANFFYLAARDMMRIKERAAHGFKQRRFAGAIGCVDHIEMRDGRWGMAVAKSAEGGILSA